MENSDKKDIIVKIQKLLSLANSPNEFEAKLAADRASEMLTRYNLKLSQIDGYQSEKCARNYTSKKCRASWEHKFCRSIITEFFFVKTVDGRKYDAISGQTFAVWTVLGEEHNVMVAEYVYMFLVKSFCDLFGTYRKSSGCPASARQSYYAGLTRGLREQLQGTRNKIQTETSLVVIPDPSIDKFMEEMFGEGLVTKSVSFNVRDKNALDQGTEDGKKLRIAKGLDNKSENKNLYLGSK